MSINYRLFLCVFFCLTFLSYSSHSLSMSLTQRVGDFKKMGEQELVTAMRSAFESKITETKSIKECKNIGKQWELAFPRLEKLSPKQLEAELKDSNDNIFRSSKCGDDQKEIVALIKGLVIVKKNNLPEALEQLINLLEGESTVNPSGIE